MPFRIIVLALGALLVFAGIGLSLFWLSQMGGQNDAKLEAQPVQQAAPRREALLEAAQPLRAGTLIRPADLRWREIDVSEARPGTVLRKDASENDYLGAIVTRDFAEGETLAAAGLVKTTDRGFLSAVLKPGMRAVTIAVDVPQGAAGMVLPGDRVDVVLTQNLAGLASVANDPSRKSVAETVLTNVRVIAVDQGGVIGIQQNAGGVFGGIGRQRQIGEPMADVEGDGVTRALAHSLGVLGDELAARGERPREKHPERERGEREIVRGRIQE